MLQSRSGVAYIAMAIHMYCKCMFQMVQPFKTYIATVSSECCICCSGYTRMLQVCFSNASVVSSRCCICCCSYTRMLQVYVVNVSPISHVRCKCFIWILLYIAMVIYICCKRLFQLFHLILVCCSRCCSPHALTHGHARAARTHLALPISVMRANSNSQTCTQ
jgi:hypothetical protein